MSANSSPRQPVLLTLDRDFLRVPEVSAVSARHVAYGLRVNGLAEGQVEGLDVVVAEPGSSSRLTRLWERHGYRVSRVGLASLVSHPDHLRELGASTKTLIAGDPFVGGALVNRLASRTSSVSQVQCHGDFGDQAWAQSTKDRVKRLVAARTLPRAGSVRAVSGPQARKIMKTFDVTADRLVVAPVPVAEEFFDASVQDPDGRPTDVYFVGRMHPERGIDLWAQTADVLSRHGGGFRFHVVGSGPLEPKFRGLLASQGLRSQTTWHGSLAPQELATLLGASGARGVLLNTAPLEAYGRSMAEASLCGLRVVALKTSGAEALTGLFPGIEIVPDADPVSLAHCVSGLGGREVLPEDLPAFRRSYRLMQESAMDRLVQSWLW